LKHEKFVELLKGHVPPERLIPEEEEKRFNEMVAREGIDADYVTTAMKKKSIGVIEEIIKICNRYGYDWKTHQGVFLKGEKTLGYMFELASLNGINPSELTNYDICLNIDMFREHVKHIVNQRGLEFKEPEIQKDI